VKQVEQTKGSIFLRMKTNAVSEMLWCKGKTQEDISNTLVTLTAKYYYKNCVSLK